uniref:Transmembrane protein 220 n=1 Tax=Leptobrachium leishanense TaxID=445787 RepID=A0A8C5QXZ2_9ANUR
MMSSSPFTLCSQTQQRLWRVCNALMSVFFGLAAFVQVLYLVPAFLVLLVGVNPDIPGHGIWKTLADLHTAVCVTGAAYLLGNLYLSGTKNLLHEEEGRQVCTFICFSSLCNRASVGGFRVAIAFAISAFPFLVWLYVYIDKEMRTSWPQHCKTVI